MVNQKKKTNELPIFRSLTIFAKDMTEMIIKAPIDLKKTYGYEMIRSCIDLMNLIRNTYKTKELGKKLEICEQLVDTIEHLETISNLLFELKALSPKQISRLSIQFADLLIQATSWRENISKKLPATNG